MHSTELPYWLQNLTICGREDDENNEGNEDQEDEGNEDEDEGEGDGEEEGTGEGDDLDAKVKALEKALREERQLRRKAERDAKRKARQKSTEKKTEDEAQTQEQLRVAEERTQRLAAGLLRKEVDDAIKEAARSMGFIDPTDALTDDIRREVDADQDEDDPTDIDIDMDSVKDAVKALADKKKHLIGKALPDTRSGSKFRKKSSASEDSIDEAALQANYPSLR